MAVQRYFTPRGGPVGSPSQSSLRTPEIHSTRRTFPAPGVTEKRPPAASRAPAALEELADPGGIEVVELVEHDDELRAAALGPQQLVAKGALAAEIELAVQDEADRAALVATLDAEARVLDAFRPA